MSTAPHPQEALQVHVAGRRLRDLLRTRGRLMQRIAERKTEVAATTERARTCVTSVMSKAEGLKERVDAIRRELRALFAELLAPGRGSKRARRVIADIHAELVMDGVLDDPNDAVSASASASFDDDDVPSWGDDGRHAGPSNEEVSAAAPRGAAKGQETVRSLFRRLAIAMHPDCATDETDRARRTELMKEVTRAYDEADMARLLELEAEWTAGASASTDAGATSMRPSIPADDTERCRRLEAEIRALRAQLRALDRELRKMREVGADPMFGESMDAFVAECEGHVAELERMRDFVVSYRDGKISLATFAEGPPPPEGSDDDDFDDLLDAIDDDGEEDPLDVLLRVMDEVVRSNTATTQRASRGRKAGKRTKAKRR